VISLKILSGSKKARLIGRFHRQDDGKCAALAGRTHEAYIAAVNFNNPLCD
jgi:hypothetical protein